MGRLPLVRRSTLIMPVNRPQFVEKAWRRGADAIQLDLEDSIPLTEKAEARKFVGESIQIAGQGKSDVLVRINNTVMDLELDLEASVFPGLHGIVVPKVESGSQIKEIESILSKLENSRNIESGFVKLGILIETAKGFNNIKEIVTEGKRAVTVNLGTEDFTLDLEMELEDGSELLYPKLQTIIAARSANLQPLGLIGSMANFRDLEGLYQNARKSYRYGFKGASCIHPSQVSVLNQAFSPTNEVIEHAKRVIEAFEEAKQKGHASTSIDGAMIDIPIAARAYRVLERHQAILLKEQQKTV